MSADEKVNILMVDDQPAKLLSYEVILADLGENLIKASSASEALNILLKTDVAVVLMDVSMPDVDGFELAEVIRQHPRFQRTAIIFISGVHLTVSDMIQGYGRGAVDYISVPVVPEVLRAKISIFVELHRKTRMLENLNRELEKRVEERTEELRKSEAQFRMRAELLDLTSEAIIVRDFDGKIQFWNSGAERTYGWTREEALGQDLHTLLQTISPIPIEQIDQELRERHTWHGRFTQTTKSGNRIVTGCHKNTNLDGDAILEVNRDMTLELRTQDALRETEKLAAMGRVAGIIAHEINNPLEAITNIFYLLRNHPSLSEDARTYADMAEQELQRVSHITRQTLSFYRESKQPIQVFLPQLLNDVLELQNRALSSSRIAVRKDYSAAASVTGFPVELRQIFLNLIGNAIQAMPEGGVLGVFVREATDWTRNLRGIAISVLDTGNGIHPDATEQLFQPFFSTKSTKGTGLGLWISNGIVQKYDGRITCRSVRRKDGCVTCFRVFLPGSGTLDRGAAPEEETAKVGSESFDSSDGAAGLMPASKSPVARTTGQREQALPLSANA
ncbi:putative PAS/PAC sensor hybrid histidine kinase [Candidatus Sulfotelmatomonas gaucii]|uniref:histidine kinase n=1 Tax=Candidatus Sulfuritelmatomonas gaucii TaxID=2043161 RepID=A0A2N9L2Z3_9BACT|nr:putative PAS/PAC sensor hybrid histidine kinase [Candidatus Sulfotelmatomonas gaucii]